MPSIEIIIDGEGRTKQSFMGFPDMEAASDCAEAVHEGMRSEGYEITGMRVISRGDDPVNTRPTTVGKGQKPAGIFAYRRRP